MIKGGRESRESGARGARGATRNESRALKFSLCKHGSRHASHKTRARYLARLYLATGKRRPSIYVYICISVQETATCHTQASPRTSAARYHRSSSFIRAC